MEWGCVGGSPVPILGGALKTGEPTYPILQNDGTVAFMEDELLMAIPPAYCRKLSLASSAIAKWTAHLFPLTA